MQAMVGVFLPCYFFERSADTERERERERAKEAIVY